MRLLKFFTTRNAFSREYGTRLIVLFNLAFVPVFMQKISLNIILFSFSILFFLMFRFELLDFFSIELQYSKKAKIARGLIYLIFSAFLFFLLMAKHFIGIKLAFLICVSGISMLFLNIITRRKKGERQIILAQIILVCFMSFLGALNYYFLVRLVDANFMIIFLFNALFFTISVIYVRSKTVGSPYDVYALVFSLITVFLIIILNIIGVVKLTMVIVFIPTLVKTLDNVVLTNTKVPLRRIGINETIHCIIFVFLFSLLH